ncbi:MAG: GNAT family N-acetyltransferase [Verrucomicrobia bacterium]|nr:GNAT family N-acetyltransferase [Verrucomicrobiota bacterium]
MKRAATVADAVAMAEVHVASWRAAYKGILPDNLLDGLSIESRRQMWRSCMEEKKCRCFVWLIDGEVAAFAAIGPARDDDLRDSNALELYAIHFRPGWCGLGLGTIFWQEIEKEIEGNTVVLWVLEQNARARRFYGKNGFTLEEDKKKLFAWQGMGFPEVRYRKRVQRAVATSAGRQLFR